MDTPDRMLQWFPDLPWSVEGCTVRGSLPGDAEAFVSHIEDPEVHRYLGDWRAELSREARVEAFRDAAVMHSYLTVVRDYDSQAVGFVRVRTNERDNRKFGTVTITLSSNVQRQGIGGTLFVKAVAGVLAKLEWLAGFECVVDRDNAGSMKLMKRWQFSDKGSVPPKEGGDNVRMFRISREQWGSYFDERARTYVPPTSAASGNGRMD